MNYIKMKSGLKKGIVGARILGAILLFTTPLSAQTDGKSGRGLYEPFSTKPSDGVQWVKDNKYVRKGGYSKKTENYIYVGATKSPAEMTGLLIPIRENPGPGEYHYITFVWAKQGREQIGTRFHVSEKLASQKGKKYDFTYIAGEPKDLINQLKGLDLGDKPGYWMVMIHDLWKGPGNITLTGMLFICPERRDAGFDKIFLAKTQDGIKNAPKALPSGVATVVSAVEEDDELMYDEVASDSIAADQGVQIDWGAQIKAGDIMMYPLYSLELIALVIAIQRLITSRQGCLVPKLLCRSVNECLANGDLKGTLVVCGKCPSTLANSLRFIFEHVKAGHEAVSQAIGGMATRNIRAHLARIYPLSVIASLAPSIGLLGTVVGMIEVLGLVALYGDEGGTSILFDPISKTLITTTAGLIIAAPTIALYFVIKNRIMHMASPVEVRVEEVTIKLYLDNKEKKSGAEL